MRARLTALAVLGALLLGATDADEGPHLEDTGWWWVLQTGLVEVPPPPSVPEDGLMVGNGGEDPTAVAGIRYLVDDDAVTATLTLEVASEQGGETAGIKACPAIARWRGAHAGRWDQQPTSDCSQGEVRGERSEDGETWTFELAPLVDKGMANVILQPAALEAPSGGSEPQAPEGEAPAAPPEAEEGEEEPAAPFQIAFEAPEDASLEVGGGFGGGSDIDVPDPSGAAPDAASSDAPSSVEESATLDLQTDGSSGDAAPSPERAESPQVAESTPPVDDEQVALVAPDGEQDTAGGEPMAMQQVGFGQDRIRQVAAVIALACGLAALLLWRGPDTGGLAGLRPGLIVRPEQAARQLQAGTSQDEGVRGLGRFRSSRTGAPPPL